MRIPAADGKKVRIGFHDDSFGYATLPHPERDWHFLSLLKRAGILGRWRNAPIGGEVRPEIQEHLWKKSTPDDLYMEDFDECLRETHCSWLINQHVFNRNFGGSRQRKAIQSVQRMGYELHLSSVQISDVDVESPLSVRATFANRGGAPFYYRWKVQLQIKKKYGGVVQTWDTGWDIRKVMPGDKYSPLLTIQNHGLETGVYRFALRIENPLASGKPVMLANGNQSKDGWLEIADFRVMKATDTSKK